MYAIFCPQRRKSTAKFRYFSVRAFTVLPTKTLFPLFFSYTTPNKPFSILYTAECMTNYIIYQCQYETVPENLSECEKFNLFVCELLLFGVPFLNVNLALGLGLW